jgi:glycosyltransferase involved in cell wall biosynthesis
MITQWYNPEPFYKGTPFAKALSEQGHEVQVLTGFPNYPGGKVYDGYKITPLQVELIDGISVTRVPLYPSHNGSVIGRIFNYCSFALAATIIGILKKWRADVIYVYHPPATIGLPATMISLLHRVPFVYDIQDLWPDTLASTGMVKNRILLSLIGQWCNFIYRRASHIVVLSPGFKNRLMERGIPENKISVIYNWCDEPQLYQNTHEPIIPEMIGKFSVVFAGTMGKAQALDAVLKAAEHLLILQPNVLFVFIGGGVEVENLRNAANSRNLTNTLFLPRKPFNEIGGILQQADVLLVHLKNDPLFTITIPSKTQAYLATGKPILMAVGGDAADLVRAANSGFVCNSEDPIGIADTVTKFSALEKEELLKMGLNGKQFYENELQLKIGVQKFENIFKSVASKR